VATGSLPHTGVLKSGNDLTVSTWDILSGFAKPDSKVLLFDDAGDFPALQAAELIARADVELEIMTPDRSFAPEIMEMSLVPYMRTLQEYGVSCCTIGARLRAVSHDGDALRASRFTSNRCRTPTTWRPT
jgi:hypothetical protein